MCTNHLVYTVFKLFLLVVKYTLILTKILCDLIAFHMSPRLVIQ